MVFPSGASVSVSVIAAYESPSCSQCETVDITIIQLLLERVQIHKHVGKQRICGT